MLNAEARTENTQAADRHGGSERRTRHRMDYTIAAIVALTPLLILPRVFFYYDVTPKVALALIGAATVLLSFLSDWDLALRLWHNQLGRLFCLLCLAQIASLLISTIFSTHPDLSWNGGNWRRLGFVSQFAITVLAFVIAASTSASGVRILARAVSVSGGIAAIYGIFQYFGIDPLLAPGSYSIGEGVTAIVRPPSTLGHADYFAGYLLYVVFLSAALVKIEGRSIWKVLGTIAAIAGSIAIVLSGTRGALIGLAAGAIALWIWNRPRGMGRSPIVAAVLCVAGLCAAGLAFYFSPAGLKLRARAQWALEDLRGGARLWLWRDSLRMAGRHWLIGYGPETFGLEFPKYQSVELSRAYPDFYHESPHNIFIDAFVSQGIVGFAILTGFVVLALFAARRAADQNQRAAPYLAAAQLSALISTLFVCFTLSGSLYFYATVALLIGLAIPDATHTIAARPAPLRVHIHALVLSIMTIVMLMYFTIRLTASDLALERARRCLDAGRIDDAVKADASAQHWRPAGSSEDLYFSRALAAASKNAPNLKVSQTASQQSFLAAQRAAETSEEQQNAWYNLAEFYAARNDFGAVEVCLRRSIEASPNWFKPHWALAQMFQLVGHRTEAMAEALRAADLDGGKHVEIAKFLQSLHHPPPSSGTK